MRNYRIAFISLFMLLASGLTCAYSQAKKPTLMVVPGDTWCTANGYIVETENMGRTTRTPDYERALQGNMDLTNAITKVNELMAERGFPLKDLSSVIKNINQSSAEDEMLTSRTSGASMAETPLDRLYNRAKADIIIELVWKVNTTGPKNSLTYGLRGIDAYSNKQVAASQGTGAPSFSAETPVLIEEAIIEHMDNFVAQLQSHFDDMVENGREISLDVRVFDNGSGMTLEDEFDGEELTDIIDAWMAQNTVNHRFNLSDATETTLHFEQVRIPLYRENGMAMDARAFANGLRKYLAATPYKIPAKNVTRGLGKAVVVLGEK